MRPLTPTECSQAFGLLLPEAPVPSRHVFSPWHAEHVGPVDPEIAHLARGYAVKG